MNYTWKLLMLGLLVALLNQDSLFAQEDSLDFSDLDKVEQEEFGGDTQGQDSGSFDLESDPKADVKAATEDLSDFDKELNALEGKPENSSETDTVDLDKELEEEFPTQQQATEPPPPALETPTLEPQPEEQFVEELQPAPVEELMAEQETPTEDNEISSKDGPNTQLEARLNRIYEQFMTQKISDEEWEQKIQGAGDRASENYAVQQGDTLWDISVTFFGSGYFWPKIWQLNDDITNPHDIRPGKIIKFTPGTLDQSPRMNITDSEEGAEKETVEEAPAVAMAQVPQIPPGPKVRPALKKLPPSLPYIVFEDEGEYDAEGFSIEKQKSNIKEAAIALGGYLSEVAPTAAGEVVSVEQMGASTASTFQYLYVKLNSVQVGETLTAYGVGKEASFNRKSGVPIDYQGRIKIIERANDKEPIYKAIVTSAIGQIAIGSKLSREPIPHITVNMKGKENTAKGEVIGGSFDNKRRLLADNSLVYLDIGANKGLTPGDIMSVIRNDKIRNPKSPVTANTRKIGSIKIAKVTPTLATAIVIQAVDEIVPGDIVGGIASNGADYGSEQRELIYYDPGDDSLDNSSGDLQEDLELE